MLRKGVSPDATRRLASEQANVFRRDGEYWTVGYRGLVVTLRDSKGLHDLAHLLGKPGREIHVLDLITEGANTRSISSAAAETGLAAPGYGEPVLDRTALAHYKRRVAELEAAIDEAHERDDGATAAAAQEERDFLISELSASYGLGGRVRRSPDHVERARKAVSRRLRDAMSRAAQAHPRLGRHLDASIRTGSFCSYQPERATVWMVEANAG